MENSGENMHVDIGALRVKGDNSSVVSWEG